MFVLGILIGIYSYIIFFLGVNGLLHQSLALPLTVFFIFVLLYTFKSGIKLSWKYSKTGVFFLTLLFAQAGVNLIGVLGPELSFDSLWYHLTLPKLYIQNHSITYIPGWLMYYYAMPKLVEILYTAVLLLSNEIVVKLLHYIFGILILIVIYKIAQKYLNKTYALAACVIFYSNLVVGWMSTTAYVDLARTFFELLTFSAFLIFIDKKENKYLYLSAIMMGLTISTKLIAVGSFLIYIPLLIKKPRQLISFLLISLLIPLPWFVFSFLHTGNPIYPLFSGYPLENNVLHLLNPFNFIEELWGLLIHSQDPLSPIYLIFVPLICLYLGKFKKQEKLFAYYSLFGLLIWYFTPRTGGGRFILPYLPVGSILVLMTIEKLSNSIKKYSFVLIVFIALVLIGYRSFANKKYIPVILGNQTKSDFLAKNLNFKFGDFYDIDGYFAKKIKPTDMVLIYGIHNLYYVNFPFIHESYLKKGDWFNYILIGEGMIPKRYSNWQLIYQNDISRVKLYALP